MRTLILAAGVMLLVGCKSQKKAAAEYEAFMAETSVNGSDVEMEKGEKKELKEEASWPTSKIVVKEEEASLLSGEDGSLAGYKFFAIIGSFANENNARNYKQTMAEKGFKPTILENNAGYYRVAVYYTNDEAEARKKIDSIRAKYPEHKDAWLLKKK